MFDVSEPHVVILGGGFAGLNAARALKNAAVHITLVDKQNYHLFQPLLYQVATAQISAPEIAMPLRKIVSHAHNTTVFLAEATRIDASKRRVYLSDGELDYDYLIVACGANHSYFGHPEWEEHAPGLKTVPDAFEIRRRILFAYEAAERETDSERQKEWLTFVVVGGGPTGVELAGALAEIAHHAFVRDFRNFRSNEAKIILLEGSNRLLPPFPSDLSTQTERQLKNLGVDVRTGAVVTHVDGFGVSVGRERIKTRTILWAAGVEASPIVKSLGVPLDRAGRVLVQPDLTIPGQENVYVVGDLAACRYQEGFVPGVAPAAMQQGKHAAKNIAHALRNEPKLPFHYFDKGSMATIGRFAGVAVFGRWHLYGFTAWITWLVVHIFFLIGFRNRLVVLFEWALAYVTYQRSARLILTGVNNPYSSTKHHTQIT